MIRINGTRPKLCGRTQQHPEHTWDTRPAGATDFHCNGDPAPRSALQLVVDQPALLDIRGPGITIAEGVRSA